MLSFGLEMVFDHDMIVISSSSGGTVTSVVPTSRNGTASESEPRKASSICCSRLAPRSTLRMVAVAPH